MRDNINLVFRDNGMKYLLFISFFIFIAQIGGVFLLYLKLPPLLPFFNSLSWGRERLIQKEFIFILPVVLVIFFVVNIFLSGVFYKKQALLSRMLSFNLLLISVLSIIALVQIFFLVF